MKQASAGQPVSDQGSRSHTDPSLILSQNSMRVPGRKAKFTCCGRVVSKLSSRPGGLVHALEPAGDPIKIAGGVGGMAERDRSIYHHEQENVDKCGKAWKFLMDSMQGQPVEERMHAAGSVEGAWKAVMDWYHSRDDPSLGITSRLVPIHDGLPRSLHRPSGMHAFFRRLSEHSFPPSFPCSSRTSLLSPANDNRPTGRALPSPPEPSAIRIGSLVGSSACV